jgi:hypothetical protein
MRKVVRPLLPVFLVILSSAAWGDPQTYVFEGRGQMIGQPPVTVPAKSKVEFAVIEDEEVQLAQLHAVAATLIGSIEGITQTLVERMAPTVLTLGLTKTDLEVIRASYCKSADTLVQKLVVSSERDELQERLREACPAVGPLVPDLVPDIGTGAESYEMFATCRDVGGARVAINRVNAPGQGFIQFVDQSPCVERAFELRMVNPVKGAVDRWTAKFPMPQSLRLKAATARTDFKNAPALRAKVETHKELRECLKKTEDELKKKLTPGLHAAAIAALLKEQADAIVKCTNNSSLDDANTKLLTIGTELDQLNKQLEAIFSPLIVEAPSFVARWLWLTGGRPTLHPLAADTITPIDTKLTAKKEELARLDAELATLDKLTAAGVKIDNPANLITTVTALGATRAAREKTAAEIADLTKKIAGAQNARLRDTFLYEGTYFVSTNELKPVRMQHHDALQQYVVMGTPLDEVAENDRVMIVAENVEPSTVLKLVQTVTAITNDRSKFVDELVLTSGQNFPPGIKPTLVGLTDAKKHEAVVAAAQFVAAQYDLLARGVAFADIEITAPPALIRFMADDSPARVTRPIPQDAPRTAPADVAYSIKEKVGTEDKEVGKGGYRRNRLYRVRFKTGLLYSTLEKTNIIAGTPRTEEVNQHGVDALFGVATYIGRRRDPRQIDSFSKGAFSLLTGLTVRDPTENLLVGIGFEPYGGVTLTVGGHVGRSERVRDDPGQPVSEDEWRARPFFAITFDVDFLKQLFSIKPSV